MITLREFSRKISPSVSLSLLRRHFVASLSCPLVRWLQAQFFKVLYLAIIESRRIRVQLRVREKTKYPCFPLRYGIDHKAGFWRRYLPLRSCWGTTDHEASPSERPRETSRASVRRAEETLSADYTGIFYYILSCDRRMSAPTHRLRTWCYNLVTGCYH